MKRMIRNIGLAFVTSILFTNLSRAGTWTQQSPATSPPARQAPAMAYDAAHGQVVLFGGNSADPFLSDTWVWDGTNWTQKFPATSPPGRFFHAMAYDGAHGQVVLFGGYGSIGPGMPLSDTWVWDGTNWTQKFPATSPPPTLVGAMAYDAAHSEVVLFGGRGGNFTGTWVWDGTNWTEQHPATSPPLREGNSLAYDAVHGQVVMFGGEGVGFYNDTWVWDGTNWTQMFPSTSPPPRAEHGIAYDAAHGQVVVFGGFGTPDHKSRLNDTWVWDGTNWTQQSPATSPPARAVFAMEYDAARGQVVLFAGGDTGGASLDDTWLLATPPPSHGPLSPLYLTGIAVRPSTGLVGPGCSVFPPGGPVNVNEIVAIQGASVINSWITHTALADPCLQAGSEFPLAVGTAIRTIGETAGAAGAEYTTGGAYTGAGFINLAGVSGDFVDGTRDATHNYAISSAGMIYSFDLNWQNPTLLFTIPPLGTSDIWTGNHVWRQSGCKGRLHH
jgi:hypothetical protein